MPFLFKGGTSLSGTFFGGGAAKGTLFDICPLACKYIIKLLLDYPCDLLKTIVTSPYPRRPNVARKLLDDGKGEVDDVRDKAVVMVLLVGVEAVQVCVQRE